MIERADPNDLMQLAFDVGAVPLQIAGVVVLDPGAGLDLEAASALVALRLGRVPRLGQRLVRPPIGCGRAYWVDDATFDPGRHVHVTACVPPGDEAALLDTALALATRPLPRSRPLWSATFVTGLTGEAVALVVVLHHVVADGIGGLAVMGELVDTDVVEHDGTGRQPPRPRPSRGALAVDAWTRRVRALSSLPKLLAQMRAGVAELGASRPDRAPLTSLNRPTGSRRAVRVVRARLDAVVGAAHDCGGTVNDVVLTAVTGALGALLASRGETVPRLVVSVPVSARPSVGSTELGNRVGVIPMALPTDGDPVTRLKSVVATTRARKQPTPGASAALLQPAFRALSALGVLGWFINHQRLVNTFVTNMRGPETPMTFMGAAVRDVIPISGVQGNATVAFSVLSYAGTLTITVIADPDAVPELSDLTAALRNELSSITTTRG